MSTTKPLFTEIDAGCYIDGANGIDHAYDVMVDMMRGVQRHSTDDAIVAKAKDMEVELDKVIAAESKDYVDRTSEDNDILDWAHYILDDATEVLQECTEEGLVWMWEAGDLFLGKETED
jgi:hypothetical protein